MSSNVAVFVIVTVGPEIFVHIAYLLAVGAAAFTLAMFRLERALVK